MRIRFENTRYIASCLQLIFCVISVKNGTSSFIFYIFIGDKLEDTHRCRVYNVRLTNDVS